MKVGIMNILVLLRRIFVVSDAAVWTPLEPVGMLLEPGMIRCALDREVERNLHVQGFRGFDQGMEIVECPKFRMNGVVSAFNRADRIGASGIAGFSCQRIVATLAV